jgi:hypothetical protein
MRFYFASKIGNLTKIKPQSLISSQASVVYNLNLFDYYTEEKWKKEDLKEEYKLTPKIKFKKDRIPNGHPYLYKGVITDQTVEKGVKFPKLFTNKEEVSVIKVIGSEYNQLIDDTKKYNLSMENFN